MTNQEHKQYLSEQIEVMIEVVQDLNKKTRLASEDKFLNLLQDQIVICGIMVEKLREAGGLQ